MVIGLCRMTQTKHIWHCGSFCFDQSQTLVMGILNVTPDSFSDGGRYADTFDALIHANELCAAGADIIDVGGESTRPGSAEVSLEEELNRVLPVVKALAAEGICVAVDTRHASVAKACVDAGASIINDISGFEDPAMIEVAANSTVGCVIMHMQGTPGTMQDNPVYKDVVAEVSSYLFAQAEILMQAGVAPERICVDPGPGFGKTLKHNIEMLKNSAAFAHLGELPFISLAAWSRKGTIGELSGVSVPSERLGGSIAAALYAAEHGAGVVRVHDVKPTVEALKVLYALRD